MPSHTIDSPVRVRSLRPARWLIAAIGACAIVGSAHAEKFKVDGANGETIQSAVDLALNNADDQDVIVVKPGIYAEVVTIDYTGTTQTSLTIRAAGKKNQFEVQSPSGAAMIIRNASAVTVSDATLTSSSSVDGIPALLINNGSKNITCRDLFGTPGDDVGVVILGSSNTGCLFEDCDFSGMAGSGFIVDGMGHEFRSCAMNDCGLNGLVLTDQALLCTVTDCSAVASGGQNVSEPGVVTVRGNGHRIIDTTIGGGGRDGLWLTGEGHVVSHCTSDNNGGAGYFLSGATGVFEDCSADGNSSGIEGGGLSAHIIGGTFKSNLSHGVLITTGGAMIRGVKVKGNGGDGIHIMPSAAGTLISDCKTIDNDGEGIVVTGDLTWVEGNVSKGGDSFVDSGMDNSGRGNVLKDGGTNDF